ncbi:MAG: hypothetical protein E4H02_03565 [Lentisphaerales bacterium]|nr:MAG: hypothetical protein E4H02_03565 [Lentisphaerales bacterium]
MTSIPNYPNNIPGGVQAVSVFGMDYAHVGLRGGGDLYVTKYGVPFIHNLFPENYWTDKDWFARNSSKLFGHEFRSGGTSTIYRVRTKEVNGKSKEIVLKWNRMGQDVPGEQDSDDPVAAEFNSPYEEFALVMEMRNAWRESGTSRISTHKPLAIYVPADIVQLDRTGRREHKMVAKIRSHPEIELDMFRPYAVIYEWIKGIDIAEICHRGVIDEETMGSLTLEVEAHMKRLGFVVRDRKPQHIIVRPNSKGALVHNRKGAIPYAVVDFELLERTAEWEEKVRSAKRREYLRRQAHRFEGPGARTTLPHLKRVNLLGVDYTFGHAESTGGRLWVVGKDPELFDYFLPERWQHTPRTRLSTIDEIYETTTKDSVHVVWRLSRVGRCPEMDPFRPEERRITEYGYNSPFEEVSIVDRLNLKSIPTTLPRAIYESGHRLPASGFLSDESRYRSHEHLKLPDGSPVLRRDRDYIVIWGYWNKPDELLATNDSDYYQAVSALNALRLGIISEETYILLMQRMKDELASSGFEDLNFRGNHKLLSLDSSGRLLMDAKGLPEVRICNFELIKRI